MAYTQKNFDNFISANPQVWDLFIRFTLERISKGFKHYGAREVLQRIRWEVDSLEKGSGYKLNNNYSPWLARKFHAEYPQHKDFFRMRDAAADKYFEMKEAA